MEENVKFVGVVAEVRTFHDDVYLFLKCKRPKEVSGKIVKFKLNRSNCEALDVAASLALKENVELERIYRPNLGGRFFYKISSETGAVLADSVLADEGTEQN